jgi:alkylation response protein AidB-like acyl-CoA dehydrogenase
VNSSFSTEEEAFRQEVLSVLRKYPTAQRFFAGGDQAASTALLGELVQRNWIALSWPTEYGGQALPLSYQYILWEEMGYARGGRPPLGAGIIAKTIMRFATEEQKAAWLPKIRTNSITFSLGYSEPEAGSDLTGLRTRAELRDGHYIVNGQKIWGNVSQADYIWLLCRTGESDSRSGGLSLMIVDKRSPGIEVRNGKFFDDHTFSQTFYTDVVVPEENRIGPESGAWRMMSAALADERHVQFSAGRVRRDFDDAVGWLRTHGLHTDPVVRARLIALRVRVAEAEALCLQVLSAVRNGKDASVAAAANKVMHTDAVQEIARFVMDVGGPDALVHTRAEDPESIWRQTMTESVGGGTSEIMKSIVARQELGLAS